MKRVLTHGTFDLLHYGHIEYLRKAKMLGDYLIVSLSTDEFAAEHGKKTYYNYGVRKKMLEAIRYVDLVIEQTKVDKRDAILKYGVDIFVNSDEYRDSDDYLKELCEVIYFERTPEISTTKVKAVLCDVSSNE